MYKFNIILFSESLQKKKKKKRERKKEKKIIRNTINNFMMDYDF